MCACVSVGNLCRKKKNSISLIKPLIFKGSLKTIPEIACVYLKVENTMEKQGAFFPSVLQYNMQ